MKLASVRVTFHSPAVYHSTVQITLLHQNLLYRLIAHASSNIHYDVGEKEQFDDSLDVRNKQIGKLKAQCIDAQGLVHEYSRLTEKLTAELDRYVRVIDKL